MASWFVFCEKYSGGCFLDEHTLAEDGAAKKLVELGLNEYIARKLEKSDFSSDQKKEMRWVLNKLPSCGGLSLQLRKMIWAVLVDNKDIFLINLEDLGWFSLSRERPRVF